jgi:GTPase
MPLVAIVGRPNTGKSTLFNRLAGSKKALVDGIPGVTRDLHYARVNFCDRNFDLVDTGGMALNVEDELIERVVEAVHFAIEEADCIIFMLDARSGLTPDDRDIADLLRKTEKKVFFVANKVESPKQEQAAMEFYSMGMEELELISAREKTGVWDLFEKVVDALPEAKEDEETLDESGIMRTRIAVVGKPNVGKSSLINKLVGAERLIVSDLPGTTRDAIDIPFEYGGKPYMLIDTAGIRRKAKVKYRLEKYSVIKALKSLDRCHVALALVDATEGFDDQTLRVTTYAIERGRAVIWLFNKIDLIEDITAWRKLVLDRIDFRLRHLNYVPSLEISAKTGKGIGRIFPVVERVSTAHNLRLDTGPLNRLIEAATTSHTPPIVKNRQLKFYYTTQTSVRPPTFVIFTNYPDAVHFSYERFLTRTIRESADFTGVPIRLLFKKRTQTGK